MPKSRSLFRSIGPLGSTELDVLYADVLSAQAVSGCGGVDALREWVFAECPAADELRNPGNLVTVRLRRLGSERSGAQAGWIQIGNKFRAVVKKVLAKARRTNNEHCWRRLLGD